MQLNEFHWIDYLILQKFAKDNLVLYNGGKNNYARVREKSNTVALKTLTSSKENSFNFLKEFINHMLIFKSSKLKFSVNLELS